jgi:hypothetical protein
LSQEVSKEEAESEDFPPNLRIPALERLVTRERLLKRNGIALTDER